jgi:hypothetical protein
MGRCVGSSRFRCFTRRPLARYAQTDALGAAIAYARQDSPCPLTPLTVESRDRRPAPAARDGSVRTRTTSDSETTAHFGPSRIAGTATPGPPSAQSSRARGCRAFCRSPRELGSAETASVTTRNVGRIWLGLLAQERSRDHFDRARRAIIAADAQRPEVASRHGEPEREGGVVTGASRGLGKGIALGLGEAGATVYVTGRSTQDGGGRCPAASAAPRLT